MPDELIPVEIIENKIFIIRGHRVMLDSDLAEFYGVKTMVFNQAVKRNIKRFPSDEFMFQLTDTEKIEVITICDNLPKVKFSPHNPYVFTEFGVAMLSSILNSDQAISINIQIIKAFVNLRKITLTSTSQVQEICELKKLLLLYMESNDHRQNEQDKMINQIAIVLNDLMDYPREPKQIGFKAD